MRGCSDTAKDCWLERKILDVNERDLGLLWARPGKDGRFQSEDSGPKKTMDMVFGTRDLKYQVLEPSGNP